METTDKPWRRWTRWVVGGVVVAALLLVGGPFIFIHFIEKSAPAPLTLSTDPTNVGASQSSATSPAAGGLGATPSPAGATVTWKVSSGSEAGYRVGETLFGQSNTAVGRTSGGPATTADSGTLEFLLDLARS